MPSNLEVRQAVEDSVETEIQRCDVDQRLSYKQYDAILKAIADEVFNKMLEEMRPEMNWDDRAAIMQNTGPMVEEAIMRVEKSRFEKFERVVCRIGGEYGWAPGTIQALNEDDPGDPTGQTKLPYVVKLDAPLSRLISVPHDVNSLCRAEVCFGKMAGALSFTMRCKPLRKESGKLRFGVGERVACAVEDDSGEFTVWEAGTIAEVDYDMERDAMECERDLALSWDWTKRSGVVPYRVMLDGGGGVLVHRDTHWLVRDLTLQPAGPRQSEDGTRNLKRLVKRRRGESDWELIDHVTRRVRVQAGGDTSDDDSDDEGVPVS